FAGKKSAQIREILISESAWEEMTCLFAPSLILITLLRWIQHLTSLGRVGETTAQVEQAAIETFIARARNPCLGGYPWLE
ncbi:hypothetical protein P2R59_22230, partial [Escherichia coli]